MLTATEKVVPLNPLKLGRLSGQPVESGGAMQTSPVKTAWPRKLDGTGNLTAEREACTGRLNAHSGERELKIVCHVGYLENVDTTVAIDAQVPVVSTVGCW